MCDLKKKSGGKSVRDIWKFKKKMVMEIKKKDLSPPKYLSIIEVDSLPLLLIVNQ